MRGKRLVELAFRFYPHWWRERYGVEAGHVATGLLKEGRSVARVTASFAWDGIRSRFRRTPLELRGPAPLSVQRADGAALSAAMFFFLFAFIVLGCAAEVYYSITIRFEFPTSPIWPPERGWLETAVAALAVGAAAFVLAAIGSGLTSLWRALRKHDARSVLLACLSLVSLAILPIVFPVAVHASGGTGLGFSGTWFATLLTFQRNLATRAVSPLRIDIVAVLSWLFILAMIAISAWAARKTRERVGLARVHLRLESALTGVSAVAMIVGWGALVAWGVSVPPVPAAIDPCSHAIQCFGPFVAQGLVAPEPSLSVAWWLTLVAMGLAMLRSAVAGLRAVREGRGLTAARAG